MYSQINVSGNAKLTLNPGVYVIAGGGFTVSGNATVTGAGVLIYNAGSAFLNTGGTIGAVTLSGNSTVNLRPATSGDDPDIALFQARDNPLPLVLSGNAMLGLSAMGFLYAPAAALVLSGNSNLAGLLAPNGFSAPNA